MKTSRLSRILSLTVNHSISRMPLGDRGLSRSPTLRVRNPPHFTPPLFLLLVDCFFAFRLGRLLRIYQ